MQSLLIGLLIGVAILSWFLAGMIALGYHKGLRLWLDDPTNRLALTLNVLGGIAFLTGVAGAFQEPDNPLNVYSGELMGLSLAVLVIDGLTRRRLHFEERRRIIEQMGSPVNDAALEAVRLARRHGWLEDGSLQGANLSKANLQGAFLWRADLRRTDLSSANLRGAFLLDARLYHADLTMADLRDADLAYADLRATNFMAADLQGTNLAFANLRTSIVSGADFEGAIYNNQTQLPLRDFNSFADATNLDDLSPSEQRDRWRRYFESGKQYPSHALPGLNSWTSVGA